MNKQVVCNVCQVPLSDAEWTSCQWTCDACQARTASIVKARACASHASGDHVPDPSSITMEDGPDLVIIIRCKACGARGSITIGKEQVQW